MNGDLLLLLCAAIVAAILGTLKAFETRLQDTNAVAIMILGLGLAAWLLID